MSLGSNLFSGCVVFWVISCFLDLFLSDLNTDSLEKTFLNEENHVIDFQTLFLSLFVNKDYSYLRIREIM